MNFQTNLQTDEAMDMEDVGQDQSDPSYLPGWNLQTNNAFSTSYYPLYTSTFSSSSERNTPLRIGDFDYAHFLTNDLQEQTTNKRPLPCFDEKSKDKSSTLQKRSGPCNQPRNPLRLQNPNHPIIPAQQTRQELIQKEAHELITCLDSSFEGLQNQAVVVDNPQERLSFDYTNEINGQDIWKDDLQDSFIPDLISHKPDSSILSLNHGEGEIQANLNSSILNDLSSILDPGEKDVYVELNLSNNSDESDDLKEERLEKKMRTEGSELKRTVNAPDEVEPMGRWLDLPGSIVIGVKRGCTYFFTKNKGLSLECISRVLDSKEISSLQRFEKFLEKVQASLGTWESVIDIVEDESDREMAYILLELVYELLSTKKDLERWLLNTRMPEKEKNHVRVTKDTLKDNFVYHLYSRCQS